MQVGYENAGDGGVPGGPERELLLHRGQLPAAGGAHGHRRDHRVSAQVPGGVRGGGYPDPWVPWRMEGCKGWRRDAPDARDPPDAWVPGGMQGAGCSGPLPTPDARVSCRVVVPHPGQPCPPLVTPGQRGPGPRAAAGGGGSVVAGAGAAPGEHPRERLRHPVPRHHRGPRPRLPARHRTHRGTPTGPPPLLHHGTPLGIIPDAPSIGMPMGSTLGPPRGTQLGTPPPIGTPMGSPLGPPHRTPPLP